MMEFLKEYTTSYLRPTVRYDVSNQIIPQHSNFYFMGLTSNRSRSRSQSRSTSANGFHNKSSSMSMLSSITCPVHSPYSSYQTLASHGTIKNRSISSSTDTLYSDKKSHFLAVNRVEDENAIRATEFHPNGRLYAVGSNSKCLRICEYPRNYEFRNLSADHEPDAPVVVCKKSMLHKGSIYCVGWNATGDLIATGSNDKSIKMMRFDADKCDFVGPEIKLNMHDGTVRDLCFVEDLTNGSSLLLSAGAGDCRIYITDCETGTPFHAMSGHKGPVLSLYTWGGAMFVTGSNDRTIRFWDLRTRGCVNLIPSPASQGSIHGTSASAVCVDPSGRLLISGHQDSNLMLYDIRGNRIIQIIRPHSGEIKTARFSHKAYYLLTGGYDNKLILSDLQGDLTQPVPSTVVAQHDDKVIQARWHPNDFTFVSTSADRSAILWSMTN